MYIMGWGHNGLRFGVQDCFHEVFYYLLFFLSGFSIYFFTFFFYFGSVLIAALRRKCLPRATKIRPMQGPPPPPGQVRLGWARLGYVRLGYVGLGQHTMGVSLWPLLLEYHLEISQISYLVLCL